MRLDPAIDDEEGGKRVVVSEVTATPVSGCEDSLL
jgi:hypothetical protein